MYKQSLILVAAVLFCGFSATPTLAQTVAPPAQSVLNQPYGSQFDLPSKISGRTYRIYIHKPDSPPPPSGYPVVMLTDGNVSFPIATIASLMNEVSAPYGALIVAIAYPLDDIKKLSIIRNRDLTPTQSPGTIQQYPGYPTMSADDFAGSELFYRFLTEELLPLLATLYKTDPANQTLAGHSLGGLFALGVLFNHPTAFRSYVLASPSIWWNERSILQAEAGFLREVEHGRAAPRVLVTAGGLEDDIPKQLPPGMTRETIAENFKKAGILVNARGLAERLSQVKGPPGYSVRLHVFDGEDHNSVIPAAYCKAVYFALEK